MDYTTGQIYEIQFFSELFSTLNLAEDGQQPVYRDHFLHLGRGQAPEQKVMIDIETYER